MRKSYTTRCWYSKRTVLFLLTLLLSLICVSALADVEINEDNFPDANFRQYIIDAGFDTDGNGILSEAEIGNVTRIDCHEKSITDLTGIAYFTVLTSLACNSNQITSLDVSGCTALEYLVCSSNQLTSLDASGCTALRNMACEHNQLTSLDVSGYTALKELSCRFNQLTSLDASGCTAMTRLACSSNQLTSLDVSGCTALEYLVCSSNQLTSLDASGCTALRDMACEHNQLTSLDVSGCRAMWSLTCNNNQLMNLDVSECTALQYLDCEYNHLTSLDLSRNTALIPLWCDFNQITEPCSFDLTALPGSFDVSKATDWQGGSIDGTVLTATEDVITYSYDCGNGRTMLVTIMVEHTWHDPVYTWNENHTKLTATHVCEQNEEHTETETVDATSVVTEEATCADMGKTTYTSGTFTKEGFTAQTLTLTDIPALGHDWHDPVYTSNETHTQLTATHVCKRNEEHTETETVDATSAVAEEATCTDMGKTTYTSATFTNEAFKVQTVTLTDIPALGHDLISHEAKDPTCTEVGWDAYETCSRCDHTTYVEKPALGHSWGEVVYSWHGDKLTAERICAKDETHIETETIGSVSEIVSPTEENEGKLSRVSEAFENEAFEKQTTETIIPALKDMKVLYLPTGLQEIEEEAFADGTFTAVIVPDGCEIIKGKAFAGCTDLTYVCVPASTIIEEDAFEENVIVDVAE